MSKSRSSSNSGGIGFLGLLTIVFITLKLLGISQVAAWSWWLVFSPIWIIPLFLVVIVLLLAVFSK
jgi:hypothetical protein